MDLPFESGTRRRIYLMRHAEAAYMDADGRMTRDPRQVPLTAHGRREAAAMGALLGPTHFDRAACSGLPRTVETAELVLHDKRLPLERVPELEEVRGGGRGGGVSAAPPTLARDVAHSLLEAAKPEGRFLHGESFIELEQRVMGAFEKLVAQPDWERMLIVGHGAVNRVILAWALGAPLGSMPRMEQDSCCLNVIDLDHDADPAALTRVCVRALNVTAGDPTKAQHWLTSLERQGQDLDAFLRSMARGDR
ncbi:MAG TPA: histidine phosphatase family protein [Myxococcota bacterium]|nr:histidine phosphatase family protein [Myxococcota bacterium]